MFILEKIFRKLKKGLDEVGINLVRKYTIRSFMKEQLCRQEFFYNAFTTLEFNGIDGDYVEFGSHGGLTFSLAYHEAIRRSHSAKLWHLILFKGYPILTKIRIRIQSG